MKNRDHDDTEEHACGSCHGCRCESSAISGMHSFHGRHAILRWILGIAILLIVFHLGMKVGEFKGEIEGGYGISPRHMMMRGGYDGYGMPYYGNDYSSPGMMGNYFRKPATTTPR